VVDVATDLMEGVAKTRALGLGVPDLALATVTADISQADVETVNAICDGAMSQIIFGLTKPAAASGMKARDGLTKTIAIANAKGQDQLESWFEYAADNHWTDGFPLTPPTQERVKWMLAGTTRAPDDIVCDLPPYYGKGSVEKIAINAVMAGAKPEYMETIIACVSALSDDLVHYAGAIATTDPGNAQMIVINGPVVKELGLNSSWGVMGPGFRSNSTIGRAVSLCFRNIGGNDTPGGYSQHVYFLGDEYSRVLAQGYPDTPGNWALMSEQLGYRRDQNMVWCMPADVPINVSPFDSPTQPISAENFMKNWVYQMGQQMPRRLFNGLINFAPEHAVLLAKEGWTAEDVRSYIFYTSFTDRYMMVKSEGYTNRGKLTPPNISFGVTRTAVTAAPVKNPIVFGEDPVGNTFILTSGGPAGGHGFFMPVSSHGIWAAREIGTLNPPPEKDRSIKPMRAELLKIPYAAAAPSDGSAEPLVDENAKFNAVC
jgi:hypothetical protein